MKISGNTIVVSSSGGAILGGSLGGPIGAIIGALAGATVGLIASDDTASPRRRAGDRRSSIEKLQDKTRRRKNLRERESVTEYVD
jgi:gas vesicle protein